MIRIKLTIIALLSLVTFLISCNSSTNSNLNENKSTIDINKEQVGRTDIDSRTNNDSMTEVQTQIDLQALGFVKNLKTGEKLSSFFKDNWLFIYHQDNRCDGSTDGQLDNLNSSLIDAVITIRVKNDGDGWACAKKDPKTFDLDFDIKKKIADWDRFEILNYENQEKNVVYVLGAGESDFLKLHFDDNNLIVKLEYRSEEPG